MAQQKSKIRVLVIFLLFIIYMLAAARPIPRETILSPMWLSSLAVNSSFVANSLQGAGASSGANSADGSGGAQRLLPFTLGPSFGYVDKSGNLAINKINSANIYLSENKWTEYDAQPSKIEIKDIAEEIIMSIENPQGYPVLLDNRVFILGSEQNSLSEIGLSGNVLWTYEFGAPLTDIAAAAGLVLTGSIDGAIEIIDANGKRIFYFEPGGSRYSVILGCAISKNGSRLGIISGVDQQRFLMLERYGNEGDYKVVYHEFLGDGFRRPVRISFIDEDRRLIFERYDGIGCYNIKSRQVIRIPLDGEIAAIDDSGDEGFLFLISASLSGQKELIGVKFPQNKFMSGSKSGQSMRDSIFLKAPFKSENVFLKRTGDLLIAGGGTTLISFKLEEK